MTVNRRTDFGIAEIELGGLEIGARLSNRGGGFGDVRLQNPQLLSCRGEGGLRRTDAGPSLAIESGGPLGILPRTVIGKGKRPVAVGVDFGEVGLRGPGGKIGTRLLDCRLLQL